MLVQQKISKKLTQPGISCEGDPSQTHLGQAHFAIPGCGFNCGDCEHYALSAPKAKNYVCFKARQLGGKQNKHLPKTAHACKYFEPK